MTDHAKIIRLLVLRPVPGRRDELVDLAQEAAARARELDGNFGVQVCSVREDPDDVCVISRWADASGAERMQKLNDEYRSRYSELIGDNAPRLYHLTPLE